MVSVQSRKAREGRWTGTGNFRFADNTRKDYLESGAVGRAGSSLEDAVWLEGRTALGNELRIGFEQKRAHVAVVKRRS